MFHYGNKQDYSNTPKPTNPTNGELTVTKNFIDSNDGWSEGKEVKVALYDAHTGKQVGETVTLTKDNPSYTWTDLKDGRQYKVKDVFIPGFESEYTLDGNGNTIINNYKNDIPGPKNPQAPAVETYGHRFQKIDGEGEGLADAEFVVKDANDNYLVEKDNDTKAFEQEAYVEAEKAYKDAVENSESESEIARLKAIRDRAYAAVNTQWEFTGTTADEGFKFVAGEDGYFKVTGLKAGTYYLEETEAPEGFAKLTNDVEFQVAEGSMGETKLEGTELTDTQGFKQIENKKVSIPQTGGIGSIIFIIAGLMLMGLAVYKMKANKEELR